MLSEFKMYDNKLKMYLFVWFTPISSIYRSWIHDKSESSSPIWAGLLRHLSAVQRHPPSARPPVSASIASHLVQVAKAPANKVFECEVHDGWH